MGLHAADALERLVDAALTEGVEVVTVAEGARATGLAARSLRPRQ